MNHKFSFVIIVVAIFIAIFIATTITSCSNTNNQWIADWKETSQMTIARAGGAVVTHNNIIYMIGGVDGKNFLASIESATINNDGSLSDWSVISELPEPRGFMSAVINNERIYVVGGANGEYGKNILNTVVSANITNNGSIGLWREEKQKLMLPRRCSKLVINDDQIITLGGFAGTLLDSVERSQIDGNGSLTSWRLDDSKLTMPRYVNSVTQVGDRVFVLGGHHPNKGVGLTQVEFADLTTKHLKWHATSPMKLGRYAFSSFSFNDNLYAAGGISGSEYLHSIEFAKVKDDDFKLSWQKSINLPISMANFTTIVVKEHVFVLGGSSRHRYMNSVWVTEIDENGNLGYWGRKKDQLALQTKNTEELDNKKNKLVNAGTVIKTINSEGYTYLLVEARFGSNKGNRIWLAAPKIDISEDARIQYSEGVYMSNFYSKSLSRKFDSIIFVGTVRVIE